MGVAINSVFCGLLYSTFEGSVRDQRRGLFTYVEFESWVNTGFVGSFM